MEDLSNIIEKEEGRRKKEEGRRKKEEGRRKKKEERKFDLSWIIHRFIEALSEEILWRNQN